VTARMQRRLLYIPVLHIDTNLINSRQKLAAVNQLEKWFEDEVILINMSGTAHEEAQADGDVLRAAKANRQIFTVTPAADPAEPHFKEVEGILFPGGARDENERNDVRIVVDAIHYQAILVTGDGGSKRQPGGILGNRDKLWDRYRLQILTPDEAVEYLRRKIQERDSFNDRVAREFGDKAPEWTGKD
jgi:hypothetical protein